MTDRSIYIKDIITMFETRVSGSLAIHTGYGGYSEDDEEEEILRFEVYNVKREEYEAYLDAYTEVLERIAWPNGFIVAVHALSPAAVEKHREREFLSERRKREMENRREETIICWLDISKQQQNLTPVAYTAWKGNGSTPAETEAVCDRAA